MPTDRPPDTVPDTPTTADRPAVTATVPQPAAAARPSGAIPVPGFTVERELGRGGMGVVFLARQAVPNRLVALKLILAGTAAGQVLRDRFRLEGEAVARLSHPGIVQVFACGEADSVPFMVLEYIDGQSLDRHALPIDPRRAAELLAEVARAVAHAHDRGIVHRDLKPGNILLTAAGQPKVTDFGLAKFDPALAPTLDDLHATTRSGAILGSPRYMAPEQAAGRLAEIGPATDVHALGNS
jgi:eukaryotic-like serine/threonine-protein kinase